MSTGSRQRARRTQPCARPPICSKNVTVTITCGNLADHLAGSFPAISPRRCLSLAYEAMRIASQNPGVEVRLLGKA